MALGGDRRVIILIKVYKLIYPYVTDKFITRRNTNTKHSHFVYFAKQVLNKIWILSHLPDDNVLP